MTSSSDLSLMRSSPKIELPCAAAALVQRSPRARAARHTDSSDAGRRFSSARPTAAFFIGGARGRLSRRRHRAGKAPPAGRLLAEQVRGRRAGRSCCTRGGSRSQLRPAALRGASMSSVSSGLRVVIGDHLDVIARGRPAAARDRCASRFPGGGVGARTSGARASGGGGVAPSSAVPSPQGPSFAAASFALASLRAFAHRRRLPHRRGCRTAHPRKAMNIALCCSFIICLTV